MSSLGLWAVKYNLPFSKYAVRKTIFAQFVGGESLLDCQKAIDQLYKFDALTILDYGAEGKSSEEELEAVMKETIKAVELAAANNSVPSISTKLTGLVDNAILEKMNDGAVLTASESDQKDKLYSRINAICSRAEELKVGVLIDAEESWMQIAIDEVVDEMMLRYNKEKVIIYNTYQLYRHDKLAQLKADHKKALESGYVLGAKFVRGAYMDKERQRASDNSYESPIHNDKAAVDKDYNEAIHYCVENYETLGSICATHNIESNLLQARLLRENNIPLNHPHINFCQLYGMSDYITFNLADGGYNVAKYVPYGAIKEVVPYLIRRAKENSSVTGEMGRELKFITQEKKRRGI
jgi:proline dehydrogenase